MVIEKTGQRRALVHVKKGESPLLKPIQPPGGVGSLLGKFPRGLGGGSNKDRIQKKEKKKTLKSARGGLGKPYVASRNYFLLGSWGKMFFLGKMALPGA